MSQANDGIALSIIELFDMLIPDGEYEAPEGYHERVIAAGGPSVIPAHVIPESQIQPETNEVSLSGTAVVARPEGVSQ